ncbi:MAG TPA: NTP transferase domain-containing protein [Limnochordia bacterium]|nr:NTP transferase domain-containing protein [Limnochordia bacterium]
MKVEAVVLAGASNSGKLKGVSDVAHEALIPVQGRPMIHYVVEALKASAAVERIVVVGPREALLASGLPSDVDVAEAGDSMVDNLRIGLAKVKKDGLALVATGDIPLLMPEAVDDFLSRCQGVSADIYYSIVSKEANEAAYPGVKRTYVRLKDGTFTGGNIALVRPEVVEACEPMIAQAVAMRKNPVKLSRLLGFKFIIKLLFNRLSLAEIEQRVQTILGFKGVAIVSPYPEVGIDVDKPDDLALVEASLRARPSSC